MKYLLDTHVLIWFFEGNNSLSSKALSVIQDKDHEIIVSYASVWEMSIKLSLGKLILKTSFSEFIDNLKGESIEIAGFNIEDAFVLQTLPWHHRDPFDRMIIAQAIRNKYTIVSADTVFKDYSVNLLW